MNRPLRAKDPSVEEAAAPQPSGGSHAISRAIDLLRNIARDGAGGARLIDLARRTGIPHPTARRILKILIDDRMVVQSATTSRYRLGPLSYELGLATSYGNEIATLCRPHIHKLAVLTEDTVYVMLRSGFDAICIDRVEGSFPIRTVLLRVGGRRPLGVGPAGVALLSAMADTEIDELLRTNAAAMRDFGVPEMERLRKAMRETRKRGYSLTRDWTVPGISGVGVVVPASRAVQVAISVSSITSRLTDERAHEIAQMLREEADKILVDNAFMAT